MSAATVYSDYRRDRVGWFFGLTGAQFIALALASLPTFWAISQGAWLVMFLMAGLWLLLLVVTVVPVHGRSATGWMVAITAYTLGDLTGWSTYRALVTEGRGSQPDRPDLPGALQGIEIHDGPPYGTHQARVAIIQNHATHMWAVTAAITHPGIGLEGPDQRRRLGEGLTGLLDVAARTEKVDELLILVRTVPDDGAERELWVSKHRRAGAPGLATQINTDLAAILTQASVRTEMFVTLVVPESRIARASKETGGGLEGRFRELHLVLSEMEGQMRGALGMTSVQWLTSPELALVCRTGFAPGDRAGIIEALALREKNPGVNADVPWAVAGASHAQAAVRHYSHDAWNSISATITLPRRGTVMGALAPMLTPSAQGERRSFLAAYPIVPAATADRQSSNAEWTAELADSVNASLKRRTRAGQREDAAKARGMDSKLAQGNAMSVPYAVCTVTVPQTLHIHEFGRRLDSSIRAAGFAPMRLDLAHDTAFAASTVPLGISLTRRGEA